MSNLEPTHWHRSLDQPVRSQFPGGPRRPVRGTYDEIPPSARWRWNSRDTASVGATVAVFQPMLAVTSTQLDSVASAMMPSVPATLGWDAGFWVALGLQTIAVGAIKGVANLMRNHGASLLKDVLAWLSLLIGDLIRASVLQAAFGWLPWRRRARRRDRDSRPNLPPSPRRPGFWRRWRTRRSR